jgi:hypothetical protein
VRTLYLDIFSGLSGDMFIGAMLDLGVNLAELERSLARLRIDGCHLHARRELRAGIQGTKVDVHTHPHDEAPAASGCGGVVHDHGHAANHGCEHEHPQEHPHELDPGHGRDPHQHEHPDHHRPHRRPPHYGDDAGVPAPVQAPAHGRTLGDIRALILGSALSSWTKTRAIAVFERVARAEGRIHGQPPDQVHFHEVGAVDSIIDVVGACLCLEMLGQPRVLAAPVRDGSGWVQCAHGRFPIPAPATLEILAERGVPIAQCDEPHELVTPTGAALLAEFVEGFGPMPELTIRRIGYGLGTREHRTRPNVVRAILGDGASRASQAAMQRALDWETDTIAVLESNIDDCPAEVLGYFVERALGRGALDVFHTPVVMKKSRPGVLLTVLCPMALAEAMTELMLRETSAFGVRRSQTERRKLRRHTQEVPTAFGAIAVKVGSLEGVAIRAAPEFESCRAAAERANVPLLRVFEAALRAFQDASTRGAVQAGAPKELGAGIQALGHSPPNIPGRVQPHSETPVLTSATGLPSAPPPVGSA